MEEKNFLVVSLIVSFVLMFGAVLFLSKGQSFEGKKVDSAILVKEGANAKGASDAKITIVEFSDFQCPACKNAQPDLNKVYDTYKDKIKFIYRDYPLTMIHKYAQRAAEASEFAADNGKFWEFHDLMFASQDTWAASADEKQFDEYLVSYAKQLGLDDKKMIEALNSKTYAAKVQGDIDDGNRAGINATPTFFVNGEETNGYGFDEFKKLIEKYSK